MVSSVALLYARSPDSVRSTAEHQTPLTYMTPATTDDTGAGSRKVHLRRTHKKSHLGCKTCKQRRIKCDEQIPTCIQCKRAKLECPYQHYSPDQIKEHEQKRAQAAQATTTEVSDKDQQKQTKEHKAENDAQKTDLAKDTTPPASSDKADPPPLSSSALSPLKRNQVYGPEIPSFTNVQIDPSTIHSINPVLPPAYSIFINGTPRVDRINEITNLRRRSLLKTVNLVREGFETKIMRYAYGNWLSNTLALAYHFDCLYHALMAFSFGFQFLKTKQEYCRVLKEQHRILALKKLRSEFENVSPKNTDALLGTSLILYWDALYQEDKIHNYIGMCRGFGAILETIQSNSSVTQTSICATESLAQAIKSIIFPRHSVEFLPELRTQLLALEPLMSSQARPETYEEYIMLMDFVERIYSFVSLHQENAANTGMYDANCLFDYMKEWISNYPCLSFSLDLLAFDDASIILYTYYDAMSHVLDAIFPETRYLFQFSFIGPIDLVAIEQVIQLISNQGTLDLVQYPLRITAFIKARTLKLNELFSATDPLLMAPEGVALHKLRHLDLINEAPVRSFKEPFDFAPHLPILSPNAKPYLNPFLSHNAITIALNVLDENKSNGEISFANPQNLSNNPSPTSYTSMAAPNSLYSASSSSGASTISSNSEAGTGTISPDMFSEIMDESSLTGGQIPSFSNLSISAMQQLDAGNNISSLSPIDIALSPSSLIFNESSASTSPVLLQQPVSTDVTQMYANCGSGPVLPSPPASNGTLPPLSSLSMGSFKKYFTDRSTWLSSL